MASSFVKKLFDMVEHEDNDIICWVGHGQAFEVLDPKRLEAEVLPKFFRHSRFQSLVRQLNFYAFKKVSKERSSWVYSHECFVAGRPDLLDHLKRKTNGSAMELSHGLMELQQRQRPNLHCSVDSYDNEDVSLGSPDSRGRKRSFSTSSSSDFQLYPSDQDDQHNWAEDENDDVHSRISHLQINKMKSVNSVPDLTLYRSHSGSIVDTLPSIYSCRKKIRRSYSLGEVDSTDYDTDVNFEDILCNWNNVQKFFLSKPGAVTGEVTAPVPLPQQNVDKENDKDTSVENDVSAFSSQTGLVQFCLEKDPWQRASRLCADIQDLLAANIPLESEMAAYSAALAPPPLTLRAVVDSRFTPQQLPPNEADSDCDETSTTSANATNASAAQCASPHTPRVRMVVQRVPHMSPRCKLTQEVFGESSRFFPEHRSLSPPPQKTSGEIETVRTFLAFSLASLHSAAAKEQDKLKQTSLMSCAEKWGEYAQCCL